MSRISWTVVLPVKKTVVAKTRLAGTGSARRRRLALAFATDTTSAVVECAAVSSVVLVTDDDDATAMARRLGAHPVADLPDAGLNAALRHGVHVARDRDPHASVALLSADLPALRPRELERALTLCSRLDRAFVSDAVGTGTTLLTAQAPVLPTPHFGARSRARHRHEGYIEVSEPGLASVRRDVDTWADLWDAQRLGVGPATAAALAES